jgi:hypothetical protein
LRIAESKQKANRKNAERMQKECRKNAERMQRDCKEKSLALWGRLGKGL